MLIHCKQSNETSVDDVDANTHDARASNLAPKLNRGRKNKMKIKSIDFTCVNSAMSAATSVRPAISPQS